MQIKIVEHFVNKYEGKKYTSKIRLKFQKGNINEFYFDAHGKGGSSYYAILPLPSFYYN